VGGFDLVFTESHGHLLGQPLPFLQTLHHSRELVDFGEVKLSLGLALHVCQNVGL
jgi:hypothetical protein